METHQVLLKAIHFAAEKHRDQRRKGATASPYINHPIAVAKTLCEIGGISDVAVLAAAVLHDTVEDTDTSVEELREQFGDEIAQAVSDVSDDKTLPKAERKRLQVENAANICGKAKLVKLADKICNVTDVLDDPPGDWSDTRKTEYVSWALTVVNQLRGTNDALERCFDDLVARATR
jgi:guanosine-3',5'-bis(diphosphate) 3'-pyrophosphohydrolase